MNSAIGFFTSLVLHIALLCYAFANFRAPNLMQDEALSVIRIENFVALSDTAPENVENLAEQNSQPEPAPEPVPETKPEPEPEPEPAPEPAPEPEPEPAPAPEPLPKPEPKPKPKPKPKKIAKEKAVKKNFDSNKTGANLPNLAQTNASAGAPKAGMANIQGNAKSDNIGGVIQKIIAAYAQKNYPKSAKMRKQTGVVKAEFSYLPGGAVQGAKITASSGVEALDEAVLKAIERTKSKFPPTTSARTFVVNVRFVLK
ncbi:MULTISPECIES: energy transducer TonB [unclassified Campylobacter]|uniref:energy transducer TonB n=1 Tax=unclassified Campylobacter TaxID=2593542 RepID=UPI0022E9EB9F|nr:MULTISPECIES: energy transducer TonB [unclassified Campylobacter]MDA3042546.1 energy transducer TonB [Campylobacter sp. JMF_09 ED2]MDA3044640.1 energy transducer TonB [Campylobacter sp. JMF_07 ED4]MDA3063237.1 energy transducer TonB [Campylobacter sp. JMF_11 EL3]MDA3071617.1 energy transducer TonB [Campylobacter sp. VBCF_03 NA9]MDA3074319.1 energy transducer TonB [Campylobacter sp. JMF_05 ED3]